MVSFELTPEQERAREEAGEFAEREIAPRATEIDKTDEFPWDIWKKMAEEPYRYTGMHIPEEYEGHPRGLLEIIIIIEEVAARGKSPVCNVLLEIAGLGTAAIINGGNEEQKKKYLPPIAKGEAMVCFSLTEPGTGSDASGIRCCAERVRDEYIINGRKRYTSGAHQSSHVIVFAVTDPNKGSNGISAFIIPTDTPGFLVSERVKCMGLRGHQDEELLFKGCRIPKESLIGEEGEGLRYGLKTLDETRTTLNAGFIGLAQACLEAAVEYAKKRTTFGKPLFHRQALSFPLAEVTVEIDAARLLNYKAAWLHDRGMKHTVETAKAKVLASKAMLNAANAAVEVYGGFGCTERYPVERYYRDARIWSFAQGTPQIMKFIITRDLFGKYKM
jgi:butyryl-CoA dehydrogenase